MSGDDRTSFGELSPAGFVELGSLRRSDILACPFIILDFAHYRPDGSCRCNDADERRRLIAEAGYTPDDFVRAGVELDVDEGSS